MNYICLGYIDSNAFASLPEAEQQAMMDSCFAYDEQLRANGHFKGGEALQPPNTAMTLRTANGQIVVTDGPFAETKEQLLGFVMIEAESREEALAIAAGIPIAEWGSIEVRAVYDVPGR